MTEITDKSKNDVKESWFQKVARLTVMTLVAFSLLCLVTIAFNWDILGFALLHPTDVRAAMMLDQRSEVIKQQFKENLYSNAIK